MNSRVANINQIPDGDESRRSDDQNGCHAKCQCAVWPLPWMETILRKLVKLVLLWHKLCWVKLGELCCHTKCQCAVWPFPWRENVHYDHSPGEKRWFKEILRKQGYCGRGYTLLCETCERSFVVTWVVLSWIGWDVLTCASFVTFLVSLIW